MWELAIIAYVVLYAARLANAADVGDMQPMGDDQEEGVDIELVRRLEQRVKELEWERSALQMEIDSKQQQTPNNIEYTAAGKNWPSSEINGDAVKVLSTCK